MKNLTDKEWEIIEESFKMELDTDLLREYEEKLGNPFLWNALLSDRRIYFGSKYALTQDYKPRYSHEQMLRILQCALIEMENFFDTIDPNLVVSFQSVTLGDYLSFLFAKSRGIQLLNVKPTRIKNYICATESIYEPSSKLKQIFENKEVLIDDKYIEEGRSYLKTVQNDHSMYEGVVPASDMPPETMKTDKKIIIKIKKILRLPKIFIMEFNRIFGKERFDTHITSYFTILLYSKIIRPFKAKLLKFYMKGKYAEEEDLMDFEYAFFPLHTEPEVTLSVYSKNFMNQIEAIRKISINLPVGMKLIVKEHPWAIGKRKLSYYKKILNIPNVILANPTIHSRILIQQSTLVTVISSSIGFEGLMLKKPVIVLGGTPFSFISEKMLRFIRNLDNIDINIKDLLENYHYDENAIIRYISLMIKESAPVDYYTKLGGREAYSPENPSSKTEDELRKDHLKILSEYLLMRSKG